MTRRRYTKTRKRNFLRHFIGVPVGAELNAVCVVLWQSSHFKNLISLGITTSRLPVGEYPEDPGSLISLIDTGANVIRDGLWHLGPVSTVSIPPGFSTRIVADNIYCDDEVVRPVNPNDFAGIPVLGGSGYVMVENYIRYLDAGSQGKRLFDHNQSIMNTHLQNYPICFDSDAANKAG